LTERQRTERALLESNRQLQELSASLQHVREEERTRIARELHDELGQYLTGIRMEVSWLGSRLRPEQQVLTDKIRAIKGQIDQTIASVRRISSELRPLVLDDLGFAAAAGWYVDQFSARTGLSVNLRLPGEDPEQGGAVATALFRVLQESLTNIARHAEASKVDVQLSRQKDHWVLSICDDGVGFVQDARPRLGIGLVGMRERVQILGGCFSLTTEPGEGTLTEVIIPLERQEEGKNGKI
jgi:signal transduction histidine kinase